MDHFAGLDVSVKETSICIVDDAGKIVREVKVASDGVPALDDDPRRWPRGGVDRSRHRRRARSLPKIQVSRGRVWANLRQVSIGRGRSER
jgi:hypothetical protein